MIFSLDLVPVLNQKKKIEAEKIVFSGIYPGLKSEFLQPKPLKTLFMQVVPRIKSKEKKIVSMIYPGYKIRSLLVIKKIVY